MPVVPIKKIGIEEFYNRRNKILILMDAGGFGDVLMLREIFEDLKIIAYNCEITFACPPKLFPFVEDHPFIDKIEDNTKVNKNNYAICYDLTIHCCDRVEALLKPNVVENRPEILAKHCGIQLTKNNMHLRLTEEEIKWGEEKLNSLCSKNIPKICFAPFSVAKDRSLTDDRIVDVVKEIRKMGHYVFIPHNIPIQTLKDLDVGVFDLSPRQYMSIVNAADYVVSVDTATFHVAGGLKKPLVGIFTWIDGNVRGKNYDCIIVQKHRDTHPGWCGPCWRACQIGCEGPYYNCSLQITTEMIMDGIRKMLGKWKFAH